MSDSKVCDHIGNPEAVGGKVESVSFSAVLMLLRSRAVTGRFKAESRKVNNTKSRASPERKRNEALKG